VPGKKFLSIEPMLGAIDITGIIFSDYQKVNCLTGEYREYGKIKGYPHKVSAVILGGETGPGARPMHPDWVRSVRDQCAAAGLSFFFKGWGAWKPCDDDHEECEGHKSTAMRLAGEIVTDENPCWKDKAFGGPDQGFWKAGLKSGRLLDGRTHDDLPWRAA
jgi:protein gp37